MHDHSAVGILALFSLPNLYLHRYAGDGYECDDVFSGSAVDGKSLRGTGADVYTEHHGCYDNERDELLDSNAVAGRQFAADNLYLYWYTDDDQ